MLRRLSGPALSLAGLLLVVALLPAPDARGIGVAAPQDARPETEGETAVIVWDAATKTEHLIWSTTFAARTTDVGLLIPTPTPPTVEPAAEGLADALAKLTAAKTDVKVKTVTPEFGWPRFGGWDSAPAGGGMPPPPAPPKATGMTDHVSLPLGDAAKLKEWMAKGKFEERPALTDWLKGYADKKWTVTAFTLPAPEGGAGVATAPVRLTFKADRPVYPYREPNDPAAPTRSRLLRVYLLADGRYAGDLGDGTAWAGETVWADKITDPAAVGAIAPLLGKGQDWWMTEFQDWSAARSGSDDLSFTKAADQAVLVRPANVVYQIEHMPPAWLANLAIAVGVILLLAGVVYVARRRRPYASYAGGPVPPAGPTA